MKKRVKVGIFVHIISGVTSFSGIIMGSNLEEKTIIINFNEA